ncbi:hypothetical protein EV132_105140 [Rhizobium sullae]|uniref:Uncharacterized protein n=1 Tax=Rhizobium sullae TaxID=50338 RepID=A0A4R3Q583_RHISU|nr:hypothetical protein EV132_105140 [Rhizobium sullae]
MGEDSTAHGKGQALQIGTREGDRQIAIIGHGLTLPDRFELEPRIVLDSVVPKLELDMAARGSHDLTDYAAMVSTHEFGNFCVNVEDTSGAKQLSIKAWNALWIFHLLSVACRSPCFSLYAVTSAGHYSSANRTIFVRPRKEIATAIADQLNWAKRYKPTFYKLIDDPKFNTAMRCYGNAHSRFDLDVRIMLLWSGIEGPFIGGR